MEISVRLPEGGAIAGDLQLPEAAAGVVLFAHGSGSSRLSPRNRAVAAALQRAGLGTLLIDLLSAAEERADAARGHLRFDIPFLSRRLESALDWLASAPQTSAAAVGLFGASTGAAAALLVAAKRPERIGAVVSRGGRPDLAGGALGRVRAPTLLIVGGEDREVIELNRDALARLGGRKSLVIVPGATHLFEEPGTLEEVARLASAWFRKNLAVSAAA